MDSSKVWLLLVDHSFQALGNCFEVETSIDDEICDLKDKVKEKNLEDFSQYHIDPDHLTVWKTEGTLVLNRSTAHRQKEILENINVDDKDTIQMLDAYVEVVDLRLSDGQILLVRVPEPTSLIRKPSKVWLLLVDQKFQALGSPFQVETSIDDDICDLKRRIKEKKPEIFPYYHIDPSCLTVWKTEDNSVLNISTAERLEEILESINVDDTDTIRILEEEVEVAGLPLSDGQILLVRLPDDVSKPVRKEELAHAKAIEMAIDAPAPSCVSRDPKLLNVEQAERPIYNWRPAGRGGPPVTIYHKAFAKLKSSLRDLTKVVDDAEEKRLQNTAKLYFEATDIYDTEEERREAIIPLLKLLLDIDLIEKRTVKIGDKTFTPDAIAEEATNINGAETKAVIAFFEFKNEFGGDCGVETALGLRKYLAQDGYKAIRNASCCPCLTVSVAGPYLSIGGAILVDVFTVEPFTEYIFLGGDPYTEERIAHHARIFAVVSQALLDLKQFYRKLEPMIIPLNRLLPNPSYVADKTPAKRLMFTSRFNYKGQLPGDYRHSLFRAIYGHAGEREEVLVKFCKRYHGDGHRLVAAANYAPKLFFCEQIMGGVTMVIMKFIDGLDSHYHYNYDDLPPNILDDVSNAVKELHKAGLVFGDLRRPNIIIHKTGKRERAMLIDFDWVGLDGQTRYPATLNDSGDVKWPTGVKPSAIMRKEHDIEMISNLNLTT